MNGIKYLMAAGYFFATEGTECTQIIPLRKLWQLCGSAVNVNHKSPQSHIGQGVFAEGKALIQTVSK